MKKTELLKKLHLSVLSIALIAASALALTGCGDTSSSGSSNQEAPVSVSSSSTSATEMGQGEKSFVFTVEADGSEKTFNIKTDKTTVGEALLELGIIEGDEGQYGLYVKKVNGISADYNTDGAYWAFYIDGKYATTGVDSTNITEGEKYTLKKEKA